MPEEKPVRFSHTEVDTERITATEVAAWEIHLPTATGEECLCERCQQIRAAHYTLRWIATVDAMQTEIATLMAGMNAAVRVRGRGGGRK